MSPSPDNHGIDDKATGLKLLPTWRGVYLFMLGSFALWVALLVALTMMYS